MSEQLLYLSLALILGFFMAKAVGRIHLPAVTGYLVAGLLLSLFRVIPMESLHGFSIISDVALGFIAFSIGSEFKIDYLRELGKGPILIALLESFGAVAVIFTILSLFKTPLVLTILLSAIGAATAPAATLMVVRQYKADGPVTRMLLPVVAMDDAVALIAFAIAAAVAQVLVGQSQLSFAAMVFKPLFEIGGALLLGGLLGLLLSLLMKQVKHDSERLVFVFAFVFAAIGFSALLGVSTLLAGMALGSVYVNLSSQSMKTFRIADSITPPIFMLFFVLSGAELDLSIIREIGLIGLIYVVGRVIGKYSGSLAGACLAKAPLVTRKYLGLTLVPQAGVAIGLSTLALRITPEYGSQIRTIILCATLIYELTGPVLTKMALTRAGEIKQPEKSVKANQFKVN